MFYPVFDSKRKRAGFILRVPQRGCEKIQRQLNSVNGECAFWDAKRGVHVRITIVDLGDVS